MNRIVRLERTWLPPADDAPCPQTDRLLAMLRDIAGPDETHASAAVTEQLEQLVEQGYVQKSTE